MKRNTIKKRIGKYLVYVLTIAFASLLVGGMVFSFRGCEGDPNRARELIESQGYSQVEVDGTDRWGTRSRL